MTKEIEKLNKIHSSQEWWKLANSMKNVAQKIGNTITIYCFYDQFRHLFSDNNVVYALLYGPVLGLTV